MAPNPNIDSTTFQETSSESQISPETELDDDSIVISGFSGLYPQARNINDLQNILYNKENPITECDRWNFKNPELTSHLGSAPDLDSFDAQFFAVYHRLAHYMDPMSRKMLEHTYQAIYDAGLTPGHLAGKRIAVFVGSSLSDSEKNSLLNAIAKSGLGIVGGNKSMFANRISYWLNAKAPSLCLDAVDCSSTVALEMAYSAFRRGDCDVAIVGGAHLWLHPQSVIHYARIGAVARDGKTKSYSEDCDGSALSDGLGILVLQRAQDAFRIYAELCHVKNEFISVMKEDMEPVFGYNRDPKETTNFIEQFYKEINMSPDIVEYVEGHGTGIRDADRSELEAIAEVYCRNREDPVLVGSVSSNIGVTSAATGITGIIKVLLAYHTGKLAGNLHCTQPLDTDKRRVRIVTDHAHFSRGYAAVNNMSVSGVNAHVLLRGYNKPKNPAAYKSAIPWLVTLSGRQESAVHKIIEDLKSRPVDPEQLALLHNIHSMNIPGHLGRGYVIFGTDKNKETIVHCEKVEYFDNARRPLWLVYSGMGSQWAGMGSQLMRIPVFRAAIERCQVVLEPKGLNIVHIIITADKAIFDNILHSFVGIAAVQIGLTDVLNELGFVPDGIIGHSVGELGCAYADGCLTAEEMILAAYYRGLVSLQTSLIHGSMAAVGLGYEQVVKICPPEIDIACHNSSTSSTISGPADEMRRFVSELTGRGIFAKEVPCSNIAYHSRYIADAGPNLLKYLRQVIKSPKARSDRWVSTSVPQNKWHEDSAKYCSAEYHTNNLLSPVLFEETSRLIPSGAVLVEVAPHGLLQAILKRSLTSCRHVPLTFRGHTDNVMFLLQAIGDLFMEGYPAKIQALYPKVKFPVSTGTPMLSHLVEWSHTESWAVTSYSGAVNVTESACKFIISIQDDEHQYLRGHVVREKTCYPFSAALVAVWDTLAMYSGVKRRELSVRFQDVHLYAQPLLLQQKPLRLYVTIQRGKGRFEVTNAISKVASGFIFGISTVDVTEFRKPYKEDITAKISSNQVYQLLKRKGYDYSGEFCSVQSTNETFDSAELIWTENWTTLIDSMLQLNILRQAYSGISLPTHLRKLCIDVKEHVNGHGIEGNGKTVMKARIDSLYDVMRCGGILMTNVSFRQVPPLIQNVKNIKLNDINGENGSVKQIDQNVVDNKIFEPMITLQSTCVGDLESLQWVKAPQSKRRNLRVQVHFAGIGTNDARKASELLMSENNTFGMEYSGTTDSGQRVMGIVSCGSASNYVNAVPELLWPVPEHWSMEEAATVPLAYTHAFYCLRIKAFLQDGISIFVEGGAEAFGQAVIAISLAHNCTVFTTVRDKRQKELLMKLYPELKDEYIGHCYDPSFVDVIMSNTQRAGCMIIISGAKGQLKNAFLSCIGFNGVYVDTKQITNREDYYLGMNSLKQQRTYRTSDITSIFSNERYEDMKDLRSMLAEGIARGYVRPLAGVTFAANDVTNAFRLVSSRRVPGTTLLRVKGSLWDKSFKSPVSKIMKECKIPVHKTGFGPELSLSEKVLNLADIKIPQKVTDDITLRELGLTKERIPFISLYLLNTYNVYLDEMEISYLNLKRIREIEENVTELNPESVTGLAAFFSHVPTDELLGTQDAVVMETLVNGILSENEFDSSLKYLCIVPGMEGHYERFTTLCERLKLPALVLQPGLDRLNETLQETAHRYAQTIMQKSNMQGNFYLLGYEAGVLEALEVAAVLEDNGYTGTVFCLGHSPEELPLVLEDYLKEYQTEKQLQEAIVRHFVKLMAKEDEGIEIALQTASNWQERVEACLRTLVGRVSHSTQFIRATLQSHLARILRTRHYTTPLRTLRSRVVLLRSAITPLRSATTNMRSDSIQAYSKQPVLLHQLNTQLCDAVKDMQCATIININLDKDMLNDFENRNLCVTYNC